MVLDNTRLVLWTWVFIGVIVFTMFQRAYYIHRMHTEFSRHK
jgi:hypothetical protein